MRIIDTERLIFPTTDVDAIRNAGLSASRSERRERWFWVGSIGRVGEIHAICMSEQVLSLSLSGLLVKLGMSGCFFLGSHSL